MEREGVDLVAKLSEGCRSRGTSETGADDDDLELPLVSRVHQLFIGFKVLPFVGQWPFRRFRIEN